MHKSGGGGKGTAAAAAAAAPTVGRRIVVLRPNGSTANLNFKKDLVGFGSRATRDIRISKPGVEDLHAILICFGDVVYLENRSKANPVRVDGEEVTDKAQLHPGSVFTICGRSFRYEEYTEVATTQTAAVATPTRALTNKAHATPTTPLCAASASAHRAAITLGHASVTPNFESQCTEVFVAEPESVSCAVAPLALPSPVLLGDSDDDAECSEQVEPPPFFLAANTRKPATQQERVGAEHNEEREEENGREKPKAVGNTAAEGGGDISVQQDSQAWLKEKKETEKETERGKAKEVKEEQTPMDDCKETEEKEKAQEKNGEKEMEQGTRKEKTAVTTQTVEEQEKEKERKEEGKQTKKETEKETKECGKVKKDKEATNTQEQSAADECASGEGKKDRILLITKKKESSDSSDEQPPPKHETTTKAQHTERKQGAKAKGKVTATKTIGASDASSSSRKSVKAAKKQKKKQISVSSDSSSRPQHKKLKLKLTTTESSGGTSSSPKPPPAKRLATKRKQKAEASTTSDQEQSSSHATKKKKIDASSSDATDSSEKKKKKKVAAAIPKKRRHSSSDNSSKKTMKKQSKLDTDDSSSSDSSDSSDSSHSGSGGNANSSDALPRGKPSKKNKQRSKPLVGVHLILSGVDMLVRAKCAATGAHILESVSDIKQHRNPGEDDVVCVGNKRTAKCMLAMLYRIPCVTESWLQDCIKESTRLAFKKYCPKFAKHQPLGTMFRSEQVAAEQLLLNGLRVEFVRRRVPSNSLGGGKKAKGAVPDGRSSDYYRKEVQETQRHFETIVRELGGRVVDRMSGIDGGDGAGKVLFHPPTLYATTDHCRWTYTCSCRRRV
eukprot:TRINITY_DN3381_c0_g2_i7.p1 TRINITY_DN3381_c0_g2~~TRINITY_DN3381_c0_g2_i7.p1  ORF type:complete len:842 (+),score=230.80 TRINITY_DN3381_c0_g2_i7:59-2584(+)